MAVVAGIAVAVQPVGEAAAAAVGGGVAVDDIAVAFAVVSKGVAAAAIAAEIAGFVVVQCSPGTPRVHHHRCHIR